MYSSGTLLQPQCGSTKVSDFLSTKSAVTCITTANIREREKLTRESSSLDKEKNYTQGSYDYRKNLIKMRMDKIKKQADTLKEKRRIQEEKRKKEEEEREKKKKKSKAKTAFSGGFKVKSNNNVSNLDINADALQELLEELEVEADLDNEQTEDGSPIDGADSVKAGESDSQGEGQTITSSEKNVKKKVSFNEPSPASRPSPFIGDGGMTSVSDGGAPAGLAAARVALQRMRSLALKATASNNSSNTPQSSKQGNSKPLSRKNTGVTSYDIKMLAAKLKSKGSMDKITEEQKKVIQLLTQGAAQGQEKEGGGRLKNSLTRMLTQAHLRNVGLGLAKEEQNGWLPLGKMMRHDPERDARRDKFLKSYYMMSYSLPPISSVEPHAFHERNLNKTEPTEHPSLSEEEWQQMKACRYIRYSKKFYSTEDIVCLDL